MNRIIRTIDLYTESSFKNSYHRLPDEIKKCVDSVLEDLLCNPQPKRLRLEKLQGNNKPPVYTIHVTPNHSHKLSFELRGDVAVMRKIGTHKDIDRSP